MDSLVEKVMNVTNIRCGDYLEHKLTKCLGPKTYQRIATSKSAFSEEILPQCEEQTTNNLTSENVSLPKVVPTDPFPSLDFEPSADLIAEAGKYRIFDFFYPIHQKLNDSSKFRLVVLICLFFCIVFLNSSRIIQKLNDYTTRYTNLYSFCFNFFCSSFDLLYILFINFERWIRIVCFPYCFL